MSRTIEVELKFKILNLSEVKNYTKTLKFIENKRIVDVYLDTKDGFLFQKGIFIRIRNNKKFDIKFNKEDLEKKLDEQIEHGHCDEVSHNLPLSEDSLPQINDVLKLLGLHVMQVPTIDSLKEANNLVESVIIDKDRSSYEDGEFHIDMDQILNLGEYLEIEKMTDENDDYQKIQRKMRDHLKNLPLKHVDVGYNELYWRKHNFELYLTGKYLLIEDRKKYRPQSL